MTSVRRRVPLIIAHRGGASAELENSWQAFRGAIEGGVEIIEFDVRLTADGELVVYHDDRIYGVSIDDLTYEELRSLIPGLLTLDALLDRVDGLNPETRFVIDLKGRTVDHQVGQVILRRSLVRRCIVTGKHAPSLRRLRRHFPTLRVGLSHGACLTHLHRLPRPARSLAIWLVRAFVLTIGLARMRWASARFAALQYKLLDEATVQSMHRAGIRVDAWTVDDPAVARGLGQLGVDLITSNTPLRLREDPALSVRTHLWRRAV